MNDLKIEITIDGTQVTQSELAKIQEFRIKHVLQEMKSLGADVKQTPIEINYLPYQSAKQLLLNIKSNYEELTDIKNLYQKPLEHANTFWKNVSEKSDGKRNLQEGKVYMHIEGVTMPQLQKMMSSELESNFSFIINPEHFYSEGDTIEGQHIIETFGCFGEPTEMLLFPEKDGFEPTISDPAYPIKLNGYTTLADGDNMGFGWRAFHQIRPTNNGFDAILAAYLPSATPTDIIEGHKWHLAIEFSEMVKYILKHNIQ